MGAQRQGVGVKRRQVGTRRPRAPRVRLARGSGALFHAELGVIPDVSLRPAALPTALEVAPIVHRYVLLCAREDHARIPMGLREVISEWISSPWGQARRRQRIRPHQPSTPAPVHVEIPAAARPSEHAVQEGWFTPLVLGLLALAVALAGLLVASLGGHI